MPVLQHRKNFTLQDRLLGAAHRSQRWQSGRRTLHRASGAEVLQPAAIVIVAGWTLNNVRLLLLSKVGEPYDPATGKGTLGRNLTHQVTQATRIFFDKPLNAFMGAGGLGIGISDFDGKEGLESHPGVLRGGNIRLMNGGDTPIASFGVIPPGSAKREWGAEWKKAASNGTTAPAPSLPKRSTCLTTTIIWISTPLTPINMAIRCIRLTLDWTEHERAQGAMLAGVHKEIAKAMNVRTGEVTSRLLERYTVSRTRVRT